MKNYLKPCCDKLLLDVLTLWSFDIFRVRQLAYVAYVRKSTFIGVRLILDMRTLTRTLIFSHDFPMVFKIF